MSAAKTFIVYEAVNVVNGNRYVGATSRGLVKRKSQHIADAFKKRPGCRAFNAAIRKYGEDAFEWSVLSELSSFEGMMNREIELIAELSPEYNITRGGRGIIGVPRTPEWMAKVRAALKGRKRAKGAEAVAPMLRSEQSRISIQICSLLGRRAIFRKCQSSRCVLWDIPQGYR
jgi:group I intron endonuclease